MKQLVGITSCFLVLLLAEEGEAGILSRRGKIGQIVRKGDSDENWSLEWQNRTKIRFRSVFIIYWCMLMADGRLVWCGDFCVVNINVMFLCSLWLVKWNFCGKVVKGK